MKDTITPKNFFLCTRGIHAGVEYVACHDRIGGATGGICSYVLKEKRKRYVRGHKRV